MAEENYMNQGPAVSPQAGATGEQNTWQQTESGLSAREENLQSRGTSKRRENLTQAAGKSGQVWDEARQRVRTLRQDTDEYARKNPTTAAFTALAIGFVLGLRRR